MTKTKEINDGIVIKNLDNNKKNLCFVRGFIYSPGTAKSFLAGRVVSKKPFNVLFRVTYYLNNL